MWNTRLLRTILQEQTGPLFSYIIYLDFHSVIFMCGIDSVSRFYLRK